MGRKEQNSVRDIKTAALLPVLAMGLAFGWSSAASASLISLASDSTSSVSNLGTFSGTIHYASNSATTGTLTITLTNTTAPEIGGAITAFAFNINSTDASATASLTSSAPPFNGLVNVSAEPFGSKFRVGASSGGAFEGGGSPALGVRAGDTGTFVFSVTASDAPSLNAESFTSGPYDFNFVVRFRGMLENGDFAGSDKVPATLVPGPGVLSMLAVGLLAARRRRRT